MGQKRTVIVGDQQYYLPVKSKEHRRPSTKNVPIELLTPATPNGGHMKTVVISILSGRNLSPIDFHIFHRNSLDPYVKVFFRDNTCRTETHPNNTHVIEIQVWDHDLLTRDDFAGAAKISIAGLLAKTHGHSGQVWVKLHPSDSQRKKRKMITGEILVGVQVQ